MGRLAPFILGGFLGFAASADAECLWVLWVETPMGSDQWSIADIPVARFPLRTDCERQAEALNAFAALMARGERQSGLASDQFSCLPCTVDPRPESAVLHEGPVAPSGPRAK